MKAFVEKRPDGWYGMTNGDDEAWQKFTRRMETAQPGAAFRIEVTRPRNVQHHRKGFALLQYLFQHQERYKTLEDLLVEVKLRCGHYQEHICLSGEIILTPKSIDFEKMGQDEFEAFYEKMVRVAIEEILPIMTIGDYQQHLENIARF